MKTEMKTGQKINLATDYCGTETIKSILSQDPENIIWESETYESSDILKQHYTKMYEKYSGGRVFSTYVGKRASSIKEDTVYMRQ